MEMQSRGKHLHLTCNGYSFLTVSMGVLTVAEETQNGLDSWNYAVSYEQAVLQNEERLIKQGEGTSSFL